MALVQILTVNSELATFSDMASGYLSYVLGKARYISHTVKAIHIIFDKYNADSLKAETRHERGDTNNNDTSNVHVRGELRVPKDWKLFLRSGANKERHI
ncbi:hypothetical protein DPMN_193512 [Dreissena polymorpha]|uniref:Uncharacterized protein n=1 Tax=Dreissena polymorpha TaxID=45954 RepID=A0A9D3XZ45_DREPO|nr:hypothetical protein DPMN_193512 [Dreissena polymorpha]